MRFWEQTYDLRLKIVFSTIFLFIGVFGGAPYSSNTVNAENVKLMLPPNVTEILAPQPLEISGVAAVPNGYAVVGDETSDHGRIWPIGDRWAIQPQVRGPESMDVGFAPSGEQLWLVLGEDDHTLGDLTGGTFTFPPTFQEVCGRGLEGLSVRWHQGVWEAAVVWEGGFFKPNCEAPTPFALPRIAILHWKSGTGSPGLVHEFDLKVPELENGERFRAPDLAWAGDNLLVLLSSLDAGNRTFSHTWILSFDSKGEPTGEPYKLEERWGSYRDKKNWEAMDWTLDGTRLVLGFDATRGHRALSIFPFP